jgi:hypothetical protein
LQLSGESSNAFRGQLSNPGYRHEQKRKKSHFCGAKSRIPAHAPIEAADRMMTPMKKTIFFMSFLHDGAS